MLEQHGKPGYDVISDKGCWKTVIFMRSLSWPGGKLTEVYVCTGRIAIRQGKPARLLDVNW